MNNDLKCRAKLHAVTDIGLESKELITSLFPVGTILSLEHNGITINNLYVSSKEPRKSDMEIGQNIFRILEPKDLINEINVIVVFREQSDLWNEKQLNNELTYSNSNVSASAS